MLYRALADQVLVFHLAFIVFVVAGGLLALRWWWLPLVHIPAALWGLYIEISGGICPLTPLENALRRAAGASGYSGSFIEHYVLPVVYPAALSHSLQLVLAGLLLLANLLMYSFVFWRRFRRPRPTLENWVYALQTRFLPYPGVREWWSEAKPIFAPATRAWVEEQISATDTSSDHLGIK
jgi:hypothetical protein